MAHTLSHGRLLSMFAGTGPRALSYMLFLAVTLAVWLPGGFNIGPISDGWINLTSHIWISGEVGTRVFQYIPRALGLSLTPGDFIGWQLLLLSLTLSRAILVYEIVVRLLDGQRACALASGLLALFHPLDHVYFWVDAINVDQAYALALGACLAALLHLQDGSRSSLAVLWVLQLLSCFTYTGFVPVLGAFPVLIWLLWKRDGRPVAPMFLLKTTVLVILFVALVVLETKLGQGRESKIASVSLAGIMQGYAYQLCTLGSGLMAWATDVRAAYLAPAAIVGVIALGAAWRVTMAGQDKLRSPRFYAALALMLVILAAVSYLPYAASQVRIGHERQVLAAGLFLLMAVLLPLFLWLSRTPARRHAAAVLVALLAAGTVITGTEMRRAFLDGYLAQESLLASVAATVPDPAADSIIVVEPDLEMRRNLRSSGLEGLSNRYLAFTAALRYMYGDTSLLGVFGDRYGGPVLTGFNHDSVTASGLSIPYRRLILLQHQADGTLHVVDVETLRKQTPIGTDISAYQPGHFDGVPGPNSNVCRMLQYAYRPAYCH